VFWRDGWVKNRYSVRKRINLKLTSLSFFLSQKLPRIKLELFEFLRFVSEHRTDFDAFKNTTKPNSYLINLLMVGYSDIYFVEDFDSISRKIEKAQNKYNRNYIGIHDKNKIRGWFKDAKNKAFSVGTTRVAPFNFNKIFKESWFEYITLELKQLSPSIVTLSIVAHPSEKTKKKFQDILATPVKNEIEITKFSVFKGWLPYIERPSTFVKKNEFSDLFLELNKEVSMFLRKTIGFGLVNYGPLPEMEVISINTSLSDIASFNASENKFGNNYFENMGWHLNKTIYKESNDCFYLYDIQRDEDYGYIKKQLMASIPEYQLQKKIINDELEHSLKNHLSYYLFEFLPVLAVINSHKVLEKQILSFRNKLSIELKRLNFERNSFKNMIKVNLLHFELKRMNEELSDEWIQNWLFGDLSNTKRKDIQSSEEISIVKDFKRLIQRNLTFNEKQLQIVQTSFDEFLKYRSMSSNYFFGWTVFILSLVLLTPEDMRKEIMVKVVAIIIKIFHIL
jgi:hypothetical protein